MVNIIDHYHRSYVEDEEFEVKCKIIDQTNQGYNAVGIRRESLELIISDDIKESSQIEKGLWYKINGVVLSNDQYNLELDVNSVEGIGESVNDWIYKDDYLPNQGLNSNSGPEWRSFNSQGNQNQRVGSSTTTSMHDTGLTTSISWEGGGETEDMSGFATGGGKNVDNFRQNIDNDILPHTDSISHEGLLYEYEFDIGSRNKDSLFYPNYEQGVVKDPVSNEQERYLTVGLDSGLESFDRPPLDLMFAIDISGSMGHSIDNYYYDNQNKKDIEEKTKMNATKEVLKNVIKKLNDTDRFGVTLYNKDGIMAKPLRSVKDTDIDKLSSEIDKLRSNGGTNLSDGFSTAVEEMTEFSDIETDNAERESRIMFMTDAMPNTGETSESELEKEFEDAAQKGIYTTFIGIGIDTNPELIDTLSSIKGSNHYFVQSVEEFNEKIKDEFSYTVTPLVFDLKLTVEGQGFDIDGVYGSPNEDSETTGAIMEVKTLFPSHGDEGTKGGVIVVSTKDADIGDEVRISTSWVERDGTKGGDVTKIKIKDKKPTYYESEDTMKAILLCKYVNIISDYLGDVNNNDLETFERKSQDIYLPDEHREKINNFAHYFENKINDSNNSELETELDYLNNILNNGQ